MIPGRHQQAVARHPGHVCCAGQGDVIETASQVSVAVPAVQCTAHTAGGCIVEHCIVQGTRADPLATASKLLALSCTLCVAEWTTRQLPATAGPQDNFFFSAHYEPAMTMTVSAVTSSNTMTGRCNLLVEELVSLCLPCKDLDIDSSSRGHAASHSAAASGCCV